MTSVAASLMILSIPLNLLVGLSLLIDQPTIGSCNIRFLLVTVLIIAGLQVYLIPFSIGLIATVQFLIIKYGLERVSTRNVLSAFALLIRGGSRNLGRGGGHKKQWRSQELYGGLSDRTGGCGRGRSSLLVPLGGMEEHCKLPHRGLGLCPRSFATLSL